MLEPWRHHAACAGKAIDFFPDDENDEFPLAFWCRTRCPVVEQCRADVLRWEAARGSCHGVAGGMTAAERRAVIVTRRASREDAIDEFLVAHPGLSLRQSEQLLRRQGGPAVSYRTLARRRAALVERLPA